MFVSRGWIRSDVVRRATLMIVIMEYKTKSDHETRDPHSVLENLENRGIDIHGATMKVKRATAVIRPVIPIMKQQMEGKTEMKMIGSKMKKMGASPVQEGPLRMPATRRSRESCLCDN